MEMIEWERSFGLHKFNTTYYFYNSNNNCNYFVMWRIFISIVRWEIEVGIGYALPLFLRNRKICHQNKFTPTTFFKINMSWTFILPILTEDVIIIY